MKDTLKFEALPVPLALRAAACGFLPATHAIKNVQALSIRKYQRWYFGSIRVKFRWLHGARFG
jgi:hypothetical protein